MTVDWRARVYFKNVLFSLYYTATYSTWDFCLVKPPISSKESGKPSRAPVTTLIFSWSVLGILITNYINSIMDTICLTIWQDSQDGGLSRSNNSLSEVCQCYHYGLFLSPLYAADADLWNSLRLYDHWTSKTSGTKWNWNHHWSASNVLDL